MTARQRLEEIDQLLRKGVSPEYLHNPMLTTIIAGIIGSGILGLLVKMWYARWSASQTPEALRQKELDEINQAVAAGKRGETAVNLLLVDRLQRLQNPPRGNPGGQEGDLPPGGASDDKPAGRSLSDPTRGNAGDPQTVADEVNRRLSKGSVPSIDTRAPAGDINTTD